MTPAVNIPAGPLVVIALATEGLLAVAALLWIRLRGLPCPPFDLKWLPGLIAALPLLALNFFLLRLAARGKWPALQQLMDEAIRPLCSGLGPFPAALVSLSAGIGEELFFRAALNAELSSQLGCWAGVSLSSLLFAIVHFVGQLRLYLGLIPLYCAIGLYLSLLVSWQQSLVPAILCHALYNYVVILYVRHGVRSGSTNRE